jgi:hypothetical protein
VQVGDTPVADEDAGALELDLLGGESLEQAPARSKEHRDDVELNSSKGRRRRARHVASVTEEVEFRSSAELRFADASVVQRWD